MSASVPPGSVTRNPASPSGTMSSSMHAGSSRSSGSMAAPPSMPGVPHGMAASYYPGATTATPPPGSHGVYPSGSQFPLYPAVSGAPSPGQYAPAENYDPATNPFARKSTSSASPYAAFPSAPTAFPSVPMTAPTGAAPQSRPMPTPTGAAPQPRAMPTPPSATTPAQYGAYQPHTAGTQPGGSTRSFPTPGMQPGPPAAGNSEVFNFKLLLNSFPSKFLFWQSYRPFVESPLLFFPSFL
jgi:hypothetical protein